MRWNGSLAFFLAEFLHRSSSIELKPHEVTGGRCELGCIYALDLIPCRRPLDEPTCESVILSVLHSDGTS